MPTRLILSFLVCGALALPDSAWSAEPCSPMGMKPQALKELRQQQWQLSDHQQRQQLAKAMLTCLASPDPALRDEIAFESLSFWMRGKLLDVDTIRHISEQLQQQLSTNQSKYQASRFCAPIRSASNGGGSQSGSRHSIHDGTRTQPHGEASGELSEHSQRLSWLR